MKQVIGFTSRDFQSFSMEAQLCYDGCYTIAELFDRYISGLPLPNRSSSDWEDDDIENPLEYDADIADFPTKYTLFDDPDNLDMPSSDTPSSDAPSSDTPSSDAPPKNE